MCALEQVLSTTDDNSSSWRGLKNKLVRKAAVLERRKAEPVGASDRLFHFHDWSNDRPIQKKGWFPSLAASQKLSLQPRWLHHFDNREYKEYEFEKKRKKCFKNRDFGVPHLGERCGWSSACAPTKGGKRDWKCLWNAIYWRQHIKSTVSTLSSSLQFRPSGPFLKTKRNVMIK